MVANGGAGLRFDFEFESGGEADGPEQAEVIFGEPGFGVADGANEFAVQVGLAVDVVDDGLGLGVVEEGVDGEVAAGGVFGGIGFEGYCLRVAAVGVGAIAAEGGDFDAVPEDDAEVGADEFSAYEEFRKFIGTGIGGNVPVFGLAGEEHVADAAAGEEGSVSGGVESFQDLGRWGRNLHRPSNGASNWAL